jgi:hypothetical protein
MDRAAYQSVLSTGRAGGLCEHKPSLMFSWSLLKAYKRRPERCHKGQPGVVLCPVGVAPPWTAAPCGPYVRLAVLSDPTERLDEMLATQEPTMRPPGPEGDYRAATVKQRPTSRRITPAEISVRSRPRPSQAVPGRPRPSQVVPGRPRPSRSFHSLAFVCIFARVN